MSAAHRFLLATLFALLGVSVRAENWPQWRGPTLDGISRETNLPAEWNVAENKNVLWKTKLPGMGGSTPIVWEDRIFLTSEDGENLVLVCLNTSGKELWKRKLGTGRARYMRGEANMASSSPSTDGKHVFAYEGAGDFACFDFDGKEIWRFNAQDRYGKFRIQWGMHVTPLLHGDRLYLALMHSGGHWLIALDKNTGKDVWKVERPSDATGECQQAYASPILARNGKVTYVIVHGNDYATGHRLSDGKELWRVGGLNPKNRYNRTLRFVSSPVASDELIVVPSAKRGPVVGVKPDAQGSVLPGSPHEQWRRPNNTPDVSSPLIHDGLVYLCGENGTLYCVDAKTGKDLYQQRLHSARYRSSPIYADGKVYLTARDGVITVVKAGPKFEKLAEITMGDEMSASPVVAGGRIYLRGFDSLYAIGAGK